MSKTFLGAALAGALLLPTAGHAALGYVSGNAIGAVQYRQPGQLSSCSYYGGTSSGCGYMTNSGFLPWNASDGQLWTSTSASLNVDLASSVDAGGLHAKASLTLINDPLDPSALNHYWGSNPSSATAVATWEDTLTIAGPGAANMVFGFSLDGVLSAVGNGRADAKVTLYASSSSGSVLTNQWTFSTVAAYGPSLASAAQLLSNTLAVQPGDTVAVQLRLLAQSNVGCQPLNGPMLCSASAASDLSHTLKFASIGFQDGGGQILPGYAIASTNFDYSGLVVAAPVPEPSTAPLLALGMWSVRRAAQRSRR